MRVTRVPGEDSGIRGQLRAPVVPHRDDDGVEPAYGVVPEPQAPATTLLGLEGPPPGRLASGALRTNILAVC
jgi:hypothetical protein